MEEKKRIPEHVAIILDGNGRWAKERGKPRSFGHKMGFDNVNRIAFYAQSKGVKTLSLYCFSTENWSRPKSEVKFLMTIPESFTKYIDFYNKNGIKINVLGRKTKIPTDTLNAINELMDKTKDNTKMILNFLFDYGSIFDIKEAIKEIVYKEIKDIDEDTIFSYLSTRGIKPVDLLIRTGGEKRLSNFLLIESFYAELYFVDTYWPDFIEKDFDIALAEYEKRDRRFGGVKNE